MNEQKPKWYKTKWGMGLIGFGFFIAIAGASPSSQPQKKEDDIKGDQTAQEPEEKVETTEEKKEEAIPFGKKTVEDTGMNKGESKVTTAGIDGVKTLTYKITKVNGIETKRELIREEITRQSIDEITSIGPYVYVAPTPPKITPPQTSSCDPNYSGACVPIASDVDCASGNGNGPAYTSGPVYVIGRDIYDLDRDGNGVGCES